MHSLRTWTSAAILTVAAAAPLAAQTQVTSRDQLVGTTFSWGSLGNSVANPFAFSVSGVTVNGGVDGTPSRLTAGGSWGGGFSNGDELLFNRGGSTFTFAFSSLVNGFATQAWHNYSGDANVRIEAFRAGSSIAFFDVLVGGGGAPNANQAQLLGIADATGFDQIVLTSSKPGTPEFAINQVSFGEFNGTVVPEPATMTLLGTGLAGLAGAARRRRRSGDAATA